VFRVYVVSETVQVELRSGRGLISYHEMALTSCQMYWRTSSGWMPLGRSSSQGLTLVHVSAHPLAVSDTKCTLNTP